MYKRENLLFLKFTFETITTLISETQREMYDEASFKSLTILHLVLH